MQQINNHLALVQSRANSHSPISSDGRHSERLSSSTAKLVTLVFTRLADLFGSKAASRGLILFADEDRGVHSEAFRLWCRKLADLTAENFKTGIDGVERKAESDYREGHEMWPPSYAEFRALCFPKAGRDTQAHKVFERLPALEDHTAKARRYEAGKKHCESILGMLE